MYTPIDQNTIDEKIHNFIESKTQHSPWELLKKSLSGQKSPLPEKHGSKIAGVAYEKLEWASSKLDRASYRRTLAN